MKLAGNVLTVTVPFLFLWLTAVRGKSGFQITDRQAACLVRLERAVIVSLFMLCVYTDFLDYYFSKRRFAVLIPFSSSRFLYVPHRARVPCFLPWYEEKCVTWMTTTRNQARQGWQVEVYTLAATFGAVSKNHTQNCTIHTALLNF